LPRLRCRGRPACWLALCRTPRPAASMAERSADRPLPRMICSACACLLRGAALYQQPPGGS
jgi:hypothetical protein